MMRKIALTGNIASGKTVVQKYLESKGYKVFDTDIAGHKILKECPEVKDFLKDYDVFENGEISREKLGKLVFNNKNLLKKLNSITHPKIQEEMLKFFAENKDEECIFAAVPLLFEAKMENLFDEIIFVYAKDDVRLHRLMERNGYPKNYALQRINAQLPQESKIDKCTYVINNTGSVENLQAQIDKLF